MIADIYSANTDWYTLGGNAQRTSWINSNITGNLAPVWYRPFRTFINSKTQVIATNNYLYTSSSNGLYALDAGSGVIKWVFPTELPLGHSPTVIGDVLYVCGTDRKIYALPARPIGLPTDQSTGYPINSPTWTFTAPDESTDLAAGFD